MTTLFWQWWCPPEPTSKPKSESPFDKELREKFERDGIKQRAECSLDFTVEQDKRAFTRYLKRLIDHVQKPGPLAQRKRRAVYLFDVVVQYQNEIRLHYPPNLLKTIREKMIEMTTEVDEKHRLDLSRQYKAIFGEPIEEHDK